MVVDPKARSFVGQVFFAMAKGADTPVSLACWLMYKYGEHEQLARKEIDPQQYSSLLHFRKDYAVVKYLSKYKGLSTGIDTEAAARSSWQKAEEACKETNRRLREGRLRGFSPRVEAVMFTAKRKIASLLGPCSYLKVLSGCRWGPGATFTLKGENSTLADKIREYPISVTPRALPLLKAVIEADPHWAEAMLQLDVDGPFSLLPCCFTTVAGCRATLVDKNAKTKRSIAIEPTGNIFLQLGVGRFIRSRLKRRGVDLDDQTLNQRLAREGSINGSLATVDLSAASDTVSTELVYELLPIEWAMLLDSLRSPQVQWEKGNWLKLNKFSSMGNGFTFELESLIFWALASGVHEVMRSSVAVGVYGDDIIVSTECYPLLTEVLDVCGFSINKEKSYATSYFRESCGKHYWGGEDVTPAYQKELVESLPEAYRFANRIIRLAYRPDELCGAYLADWLRAAWLSSLDSVLRYSRKSNTRKSLSGRPDCVIDEMAQKGVHAIPFGDSSDDGLLLPYRLLEPFCLATTQDGGTTRVKLKVLSFRPRMKTFYERSLLAYLLRFGCDEPFNGRIAVRRRGRWVERRRWFAPALFIPRSTLDVDWKNYE